MTRALLICGAALMSLAFASALRAEEDRLTANWTGFLTQMRESGIALDFTENAEALNLSQGGLNPGTIGEGRLEATLEIDGQTVVGWDGSLFHGTVYEIHGQGLTRCCLGSLSAASNIEARPTTRLFTAWFQQSLFEGKVSVRAGQLAADDEFMASTVAPVFMNGTFGWPTIVAADLPSGGPAFSLATPGLRISYAPALEWMFLVAAFSGDPAGSGAGDPQLRDHDGLAFNLAGGAVIFTEAQFRPRAMEGEGAPLQAFKLGLWIHDGSFADLRCDTIGLSLAAPASSGIGRGMHSNWGVYGVADQNLWRNDTGADLSAFLRLGASPGDRNLVSAYVDAGIALKGFDPDRPKDSIGVGLAYIGISASQAGLDRDYCVLRHVCGAVHDAEFVAELTYQFSAANWWVLQPDLQYIHHPGGSGALKNAFVQGLRTGIRI